MDGWMDGCIWLILVTRGVRCVESASHMLPYDLQMCLCAPEWSEKCGMYLLMVPYDLQMSLWPSVRTRIALQVWNLLECSAL